MQGAVNYSTVTPSVNGNGQYTIAGIDNSEVSIEYVDYNENFILNGQPFDPYSPIEEQPQSNSLVINNYGDYFNYFDDLESQINQYISYPLQNINQNWGDHHTQLQLSLATGSDSGDVVLVDTGQIGAYLNTGGLRDLTGEFALFKSNMVEYAVTQGQDIEGRQRAIPIDLGPGVMFYRRDLMQDLGFDVEDVTDSWDSWIEYGQTLRDEHDTFLVANAASVARAIIYGTVEPGNGIYTGPNDEVLVENERFYFAFNLAKRLQDEGLDANSGMWNDAWYEGFQEGHFATELTGAWMLGHLQGWVAPDAAGLWGMSHLPNGIYGAWGGTFAVIPKQSGKAAGAWNVIEYMISADAQLYGFDNFAMFPANHTTYDNSMFDESIEYLAGQSARQLMAEVALNNQPILPGEYDMIAETIVVNTALLEVMQDGRDVSDALADAAEQLQKRIAD